MEKKEKTEQADAPVVDTTQPVAIEPTPPKAIPADADALNAQLEQMKQENRLVAEAIMAEPVLADILSDVIKGAPFEVALARNVDLEAIRPIEGEPNYEQYKTAAKERADRIAENKKQEAEVEANIEQMKVAMKEFFVEEKLEDDECQRYVDFIEVILSEALFGKMTKRSFKQMLKAFRYDDDLASASEQARIDARNEVIETKRETQTKSDGVPEPGAGGVPNEVKPAKRIWKID